MVLAMLVATLAMPALTTAASSANASSPSSPKSTELELNEAEAAKVEAETKKVERDDSLGWRLLSTLAPLLTALIAALGLLISVIKAGRDRRETDRAAETTRFDERFAKAVEGLSSENADEQCGAAVLVASMVGEKQAELSDQALQLLLVALQAPHAEACERLLRIALERFAKAAPERLVDGLAHVETPYLNLANLELPRLDIAFTVLRKADFHDAKLVGCRGYKAQLEEANFSRADLTRAEWVLAEAPKARFKKATLTEAGLRLATLTEADFYKADLRRANLREAVLLEAKFHRARLAGAVFHGAYFEDRALLSILKTEDWEEAQFDRPIRERLEELASED